MGLLVCVGWLPWRWDHEDLLMANGAVATYKSHALRIWCLEMAGGRLCQVAHPKHFITPAAYTRLLLFQASHRRRRLTTVKKKNPTCVYVCM